MSSSVRAPSVCVSGCCSCSVVQALICWHRAPRSVRNVCAHARFVFSVFFSSRRFRNSHDPVDSALRRDVYCNRRLPPVPLFCFVRVFLHSLRSACVGCRVRESARARVQEKATANGELHATRQQRVNRCDFVDKSVAPYGHRSSMLSTGTLVALGCPPQTSADQATTLINDSLPPFTRPFQANLIRT